MMKASAVFLVSALSMALAPAALAQPRTHHPRARAATSAPPLTVRPRSYLDPGDNVPVGSLDQYVWVPSLRQSDLSDTGGLSWRYGVGTLPGPFTVPGRPSPLVNF